MENPVASFTFYNPTRIVFGIGEVSKVGEMTKPYGKKALVVTTRGTVKKLGILDSVLSSLKSAGVEAVVFEGVDPNPRLSTVYKAVEVARKNQVDVIVPVGGGSVIDCAKAIAYGVFETGDLWELFLAKRAAEKSLPIIAVSTLSGTGSEMNTNCVITNDTIDPPQKYATHFAHSFPKVSIIDPALQTSIPPWFTACGMADTIAHVLEKYFVDETTTPVQDRLAEGIVLTVIENEGVLQNGGDVNARAKLAWAATMALNGLNDAGRGPGEYDAHTIGMEVSARFDVTHGASLSIVLPALLRSRVAARPKKYAQFATRVFGIQPAGKSETELGLAGIEALRAKFKQWGLPTTLSEQKVPKDCLEEIARAAAAAPEGYMLTKESVLAVLQSCFA